MSKDLKRALKVVANENDELLKYKKAIEIIKNKPFNNAWFVFYKDYEEYYLEYEYVNESKRLTIEEWELLKEMTY